MQKMIINIMPVFAFIYDALITIWNVFKVIIGGIKTYTPIVYNVMWDFTETLYDRGYDDEPISPKAEIISNSWCNIDPNNIIDDDKKRM